jgi:hypothetical protein
LAITTINFVVPGLPPAKSQRSVFGERSKHHRRALDLLEAAHREKSRVGFSDFGEAPLRLEVEVRAPADGQPGDGTNYLGGIADVLENKKARTRASGSLGHLSYREHVGLYGNDRQLKEILYREVESPETSYTVTLHLLNLEDGR